MYCKKTVVYEIQFYVISSFHVLMTMIIIEKEVEEEVDDYNSNLG